MSEFEVKSDMISEDNPEAATITKAYEAVYRSQGDTYETKYYNGERLIDATMKASAAVDDDPFNTLVSMKELGPIN